MSPRTNKVRLLKRTLLVSAGILICLHVYNANRLDTQGLRRGANELIERAVDVSNRAMPEYQDLVLATLPSNPNNGPFYRFDDNLPAARVSEYATTTEADAGGEFEFNLEFDNATETGFAAAEGRTSLQNRDGLLVVTHRDRDYLINDKPLAIPLANLSDIIIRARASRGNRFQLNWAAEGRESSLKDNSLSLDLIADGEFHTYVVNARNAFSRGVESDENISTLSITPSNVDGAIVEFDFVRIVSKLFKYQVQQVGTSYETVDGEGRPVLHIVSNQQLQYAVEVPSENPVLSFGIATLLGTPSINMSIDVKTSAETTQIYNSENIDQDHWQDETIILVPGPVRKSKS